MQRRSQIQLTPDEQQLVRKWSIAVTAIYASALISVLALLTVTSSPTAPGSNAAATRPQHDASRLAEQHPAVPAAPLPASLRR